MGQESVQLTNWPIIARELVGSNRYYISHYSAMRLHGMTTHPSLEVYITVTKRIRARVLNGVEYHFVYSKEEHFWGVKSHRASKQEKVIVSDIERTILDGLDRPEFCGGIKDVVRSIWSAKDKIEWDKLMRYALQYRNKAAIKRLGFMLEMLGIAADFTPTLSKMIAGKNDYILLDPTGIKEGKHLQRWRVQMNINIDELKESISA